MTPLACKQLQPVVSVNQAEAEEAVRTLLRWIGDDPTREGLRETPARVARAFSEWFSGYEQNTSQILTKTFGEVERYDDIIHLRGIRLESYCEHHLAPIIGTADVAYIPRGRVVGISKLARVVDAFSKRLQIQEKLTVQIANAIETALNPKGVAVTINAEHHCMATRGVHKHGVATITTQFTGEFQSDTTLQQRFLSAAHT